MVKEKSIYHPPNGRDEAGRYLMHYDWDAVISEICYRVAAGESVKAICEEDDKPSFPRLWLKIKSNEEYSKAYKEAKHAKAEGFDEKLDDLYDGIINKRYDARAGRAALEVLKTQRGHLAPMEYHDRTIGHQVTHEAGDSLRDRLLRAEERKLIEQQPDKDSAMAVSP